MRTAHTWLLAAVALTMSACGGEGTGPSDIAGTYTLRTINQQSLPVVLADIVEVRSGRLVIIDDGTFTLSATYRSTPEQGQSQTESISGRYTFVGSALTFESADFDVDVQGSYQNGTIGLHFDDGTWAFKK